MQQPVPSFFLSHLVFQLSQMSAQTPTELCTKTVHFILQVTSIIEVVHKRRMRGPVSLCGYHFILYVQSWPCSPTCLAHRLKYQPSNVSMHNTRCWSNTHYLARLHNCATHFFMHINIVILLFWSNPNWCSKTWGIIESWIGVIKLFSGCINSKSQSFGLKMKKIKN